MIKKILLMFALLIGFIYADQRPPAIQNYENLIAGQRDRDKAAVLIREYENYFRNYLNSISEDESGVFYLGDQYFKIRKYERAAQIFSANRKSARNLFGAATCYRFIGEYEKAIDFYSGALIINPGMSEAYLGRGLAYRDLGRYDRAKQDIEMYMQYEKSASGYILLGDIYLAEKDVERARSILQEGRRLYPDSKMINDILKSTYQN